MSSTDDRRCRAITTDGERCSREAESDGFCHQHDQSDPTIDESESDNPGNDDHREAVPDGSEQESGEDPASEIVEVRESVRSIGSDLIGHELDGIIGVARDGEGWQVKVEVVERASVPDTQDILGQYEIELDPDRTASGFRRLDRYRRGDTDNADPLA